MADKAFKASYIFVLVSARDFHVFLASTGCSLRHFSTSLAIEADDEPPQTSPMMISSDCGNENAETVCVHSFASLTVAWITEDDTSASKQDARPSPSAAKRRYNCVPTHNQCRVAIDER